jgi:hypothetical protein
LRREIIVNEGIDTVPASEKSHISHLREDFLDLIGGQSGNEPSFRTVFFFCKSPLAMKAAMVTLFSCLGFNSFFLVFFSETVAMLFSLF